MENSDCNLFSTKNIPNNPDNHKAHSTSSQKFNVIHMIIYEEYYFYDKLKEEYLCKLCPNLSISIKRKSNMKRQLDEKHFKEKVIYKFWGKAIIREKDHLNKCKNIITSINNNNQILIKNSNFSLMESI